MMIFMILTKKLLTIFVKTFLLMKALDGKKPDFYTYKLMELADKECSDCLVEIPDEK